MRALGRVGGRKSGEGRRRNASNLRLYLADLLGFPAEEFLNRTPDEIVARFEQALKPKRYGGSHKNDWRCTGKSIHPAIKFVGKHWRSNFEGEPDPLTLERLEQQK